MAGRGRAVLLFRMRTQSSDGDRNRARPQAIQHRRRPRIRWDFLRLAGILLANERDRCGLSNPRLRGRPRSSAAIRPALAVAGDELDTARYPNRSSLIEALASLPDAQLLLTDADRRRMEFRLERLRPRQLRELGERHRVSLLGLKRKSELIAALAGAPGSPEILMELEAHDTAERDAGPALGRDTDIDYERVEELLDQARKRFQERQFEAALTAAQEASRIAE